MDVFGTVVSAIDLVGKLVGYLQAVKGAKADRLKLLSEVSALGALLEILCGRLGKSNADGGGDNISDDLVKAGIEGPLRACLGALRSTVDGLERLASNVAKTGKPSLLAEMMRNLKWPFRQEDIRKTLGNIERLKSLISLAFQTSLMDFIEMARDELAAVGLNVEGIKFTISSLEATQRAHTKNIESVHGDLISLGIMLRGAVTTIERNQQGKERQDILKWLSAPEFDQKHAIAFEKHTPGTGKWFLSHPKLLAWRRGEYNVLWCPGNPGVGKSVMTSVVIRDLQEGMAEDTAVIFVYFDYTVNYTARELVEALLSQFVRRGISSSCMKLLQRHMKGSRPTLEELWAVLEAEVGTYARVFVVIDALDETDGSAWIKPLRRLRALTGIRIFATSRDLGNIAAEFQNDCRLDVMSDEGDLRKYIEGRISESTGNFEQMLKKHPSLGSEIVAGVIEKADGMFLLARLHMNSLEMEPRVVDLRRALTELPGDLKSAYDATLMRIGERDRPLALRIFSWVIHAARPMMMDDLRYALAVEDGMTSVDADCLYEGAHLTSVCVGLVILRQEGSPFRSYGHYFELVHYTTRDHLHDHVSEHCPHPAHLAVTCLRYLTFDIFSRPPSVDSRPGPTADTILRTLTEDQRALMNIPLAEYAITSWGKHARVHYNDTNVRHLAMELLHDHQRVAALGSILCQTTSVSAIQLCAYFGLNDYLIYLLNHGSDVNSKDADGDTALSEAATSGQDNIVQLLLAREGVDLNPKGWRGETPLARAVMCGHQRIVELLLAKDDVVINCHDDEGYTPLALAIFRQHEEIIQLLLAREDLNIGSRDDGGNTYLIVAAYRDSDRIARLLLARGDIDVNSRNLWGRVALSVAASEGHEAVVKVLLDHAGVDINAMDSDGKTPLDFAETETPVDLFDWEKIAERKRGIATLLQEAGARRGVELGAGLESVPPDLDDYHHESLGSHYSA